MPEENQRKELVLHGIAASPGVAHGPAFLFVHGEVEVPKYAVSADSQNAEIKRFEEALLLTRQQIERIRSDVAENLGEEEAAIFDAHVLVLEDQALIDDVVEQIRETGDNVEQCLHRVSLRYLKFFDQLSDQYLRERASDLRDVMRRLLHNLLGATASGTAFLDEPRVLAADDLTPSDAASLDREKILGIATDGGGRTSHAVIMARSSEIPAVVGVRGLTAELRDADVLLLDGFEGTVVVNPSPQTLYRYGKVSLRRKRLRALIKEESALPAGTSDGHDLVVMANADSPEEVRRSVRKGAVGVGLFRTEALFLRSRSMPSEEEQFEHYKAVVEGADSLPVTIRTLDLGGDKIIDGSSEFKEGNPFMGFRAIRYCLRNVDVFLAQLRAILRASDHGKVRIMFPMVSGVGEILSAGKLVEEAKAQLRDKGQPFDPDTPIGCMIETPSAVTICDFLADHVDFFSIGTNDLVQYMLAVDRINNQIAYLYEPHHPAVLRSLMHVCKVGSEKDVEVAVCGEIAGDIHYLPLLMGLGVRELSMASALISEVKFFSRRFSLGEARELKDEVLKMSRPSQILKRIKSFHDDKMADLSLGD